MRCEYAQQIMAVEDENTNMMRISRLLVSVKTMKDTKQTGNKGKEPHTNN